MARPSSKPLRATRRIERRYRLQLDKIARQIGDLVRGVGDLANPHIVDRVVTALRRYAEAVRPWASSVGDKMLSEVDAVNRREWRANTNGMSVALRNELQNTPTGSVMNAALAEQVKLITSLPTRAAERVHRLAQETLITGRRPAEIVEDIMAQGDVTAAQARTIARTEIGRVQTELTRTRALSIGSEGYIWRTARDVDVRESHAKMNGKFVRWDSPPTLDGMTGHAGQLPNCRCDTEVVFPDE
jgi:SPP1 gp7 family putative phage head morphogenesis protein